MKTPLERQNFGRAGWASLLILVLAMTGCKLTVPPGTYIKAPPLEPTKMESVSFTNQIDPSWLRPPTDLFTLGPGDRLEIELLGEPASKVTTVVGPDGKLYFHLLPGIDVWGLTLAQAKARMEDALKEYVRDQPQISMVLRAVESKRVWVLGRVQAPGVYSMTNATTLLEALASAGGSMTMANYRDQEVAGISEELTDFRRSFILRQGKLLPIDFQRLIKQGDLSQNIYLQPDDFIYMPAAIAREVYVLGAVAQPRPVPYMEGMTVAAAIASAYGTLNGAYLYHVAVVRGSLTQPQIAIIDYKRVIRGEAQDVALEPGDIVYVPLAPYRYIQRYAELVVNTFVSSSAINAGSAAVSKGSATGGAGVFIPVGSGIQVIPPVAPPPIR